MPLIIETYYCEKEKSLFLVERKVVSYTVHARSKYVKRFKNILFIIDETSNTFGLQYGHSLLFKTHVTKIRGRI